MWILAGSRLAGIEQCVRVDGRGPVGERPHEWDGSAWHALGTPAGGLFDVISFAGDLYVCGDSHNGVAARWDGTTWVPMGANNYNNTNVLIAYNGALVAAGNWSTPANHIARWDGSQWQSLGTGLNGAVDALTIYNGDLIAAGWFTQAGSVPVNHIARWDGTSWSALGTGLNDNAHAVAVYNNTLVAGGEFTAAGGTPANGIARWNGFDWQPLGSGLNLAVYALESYNGSLYVGGRFTLAGGKLSSGIARWVDDPSGACIAGTLVEVPGRLEGWTGTGLYAGSPQDVLWLQAEGRVVFAPHYASTNPDGCRTDLGADSCYCRVFDPNNNLAPGLIGDS